MLKKLEEMRSVAIDKINQAATQLELNECRAEYLGKKSPLNEIMKQMGSLTPEERKEFGQTENQFKNLIEQTKKHNGDLCLLWHNTIFSEKDHKNLYSQLIQILQQ